MLWVGTHSKSFKAYVYDMGRIFTFMHKTVKNIQLLNIFSTKLFDKV